MSFIGRLQPASRPGLPTWVVGTIDALNALTEVAPGMPITSDDIGRVAQVGSSSPSFYILTGVSPNTWVIFGGPQGGLAAMDQVTANEINSGTAVPDAVATAQGDGTVAWEWASALVGKFTVLSRTTTAQPSSPAEGDRYIVPASATGADWAGQDGTVALYQDGAWTFYEPAEGWEASVIDEAVHVEYTAANGWIAAFDMAQIYLGSAFTSTNRGNVLVPLDTVGFDPSGIVDVNNHGIKPTRAGYYQVNFGTYFDATGSGQTESAFLVRNQDNSQKLISGGDQYSASPGNSLTSGGAGILYMNGSDSLNLRVFTAVAMNADYYGRSGAQQTNNFISVVGPF
ncbi:hypothetical protein C41B8_05353 [Salinisphaera hydrothermalis C41B8]|uniref:Uncharacterized protein n=1 Tax=Salinisphaera hydrothermalis (strain C41B8) TaxID=1304275 RepID=A0A084INL8_SALHC|nr:DUF2793 domain-containing protein [Salinisphaera hydrothermalis]KEZ78302.1 hypothetical protein C41B8_05353 [Salinisphaera hydrothermalis C41B8]